jgi:hypothetical protein
MAPPRPEAGPISDRHSPIPDAAASPLPGGVAVNPYIAKEEKSGPHQPAASPSRRGGPPSASLAFAETAPPLSHGEGGVSAAEILRHADKLAQERAREGKDPMTVPEGASRVLAGFLVSFEGDILGQWWPLYQGKNWIGRQGSMSGLDVELAHPTTSSRHAVIHASARPGRLIMEDQGSTNGTFVNEAQLGRGNRHELSDGDSVRFGLFPAIVKIVA